MLYKSLFCKNNCARLSNALFICCIYVEDLVIDILQVWIDTNSSSQQYAERLMAPKKSKAKVKPEDNQGKDLLSFELLWVFGLLGMDLTSKMMKKVCLHQIEIIYIFCLDSRLYSILLHFISYIIFFSMKT